jgi:hypothetical protein
MEIRSQKKASCGPEIAGADEKADSAGLGLYFKGSGPKGDTQFKDAPTLGAGHLGVTTRVVRRCPESVNTRATI